MNPHDAATTLCLAAATGALLIAFAERLRVPSIALLLIGGVVMGPELFGLVRPDTLGGGLELVVTLAVAVILFEGGLTLDTAGFRSEKTVISRMLSVGVLVTWAGVGWAALHFFGLEPSIAAVLGSLLIVTGPTVISPMLRRIDLVPRLHQVLYWEGVLVDAVGVFCAVLCFEWILSSGNQEIAESLGRFGLRFFLGAGLGVVVGALFAFALRKELFGTKHVNVAVLGGALLAYAGANAMVSEAGILSVIAAGLTIRSIGVPSLNTLKKFKLELTELAVGLLFVLLSARLRLEDMVSLGWPLVGFVAAVLFLRPINIAVSTWGQPFDWRERAFLSWLAPRGIVAASMASLFSLRLLELGYEDARVIEPAVFAVIGTTVLVQGLSAPMLAAWLGLKRKGTGSWMLIGDAELAVELHRRLRQAGGRSLVLASPGELPNSSDDDVDAIVSSSIDPSLLRDARIEDVEAIIALSRVPQMNDLICELWEPLVGAESCYRWDRDISEASGDYESIWRELPGPERVMAALQEGRSRIEVVDLDKSWRERNAGPRLHPLLLLDKGRISASTSLDEASADRAVVLRDRITGLAGLMRNATVMEESAPGFDTVCERLLTLAASDHASLKVSECLENLQQQESSLSTAIGHGVALPHLYVDGISDSRCYVACVPNGVGYLGPDDEAVRIVFLVLSSVGDATSHLQSLAAIAELMNVPNMVDRACEQRTRAGLLSVLREYE